MRLFTGGSAAIAAAAMLALLLQTAPPVRAQSAGQSASRADRYRALLELRVEDLEGRVWTHERLQGRITLVDFWATWCTPCLAELPFLKRATQRYGDDFQIIGISLDTIDRHALTGWLGRQEVDWPQIHQRQGYEDRLPVAFAVDRLPTNLLLDRNGRLRALDVRREQLFVEIDRLLAEERRPE